MNADNQQPAPSSGDPQWQYRPGSDTPSGLSPNPGQGQQPTPPPPAASAFSWTASEFIHHDKTGGWYGILGVSAVVFAGAVYVFTKDLITSIVIILAALLLAIVAGRKPRVLEYQVDPEGVIIGNKEYSYAEFKSFAIMREEAMPSIMFLPLKRFMPSITVYYEPQDEASIVGVLSNYLPLEERNPDMIDRLSGRIRF